MAFSRSAAIFFAIAFVMNKMELGTVGGPRSYALVDAAYDSFDA